MSSNSPHKSSPNWKKPSEIMKMRRRKQRSGKVDRKLVLPPQVTDKSANNKMTVKRRNPFSQTSDPKKQRSSIEMNRTNTDSQLFSVLNQVESNNKVTRGSIDSTQLNNILQHQQKEAYSDVAISEEKCGSDSLPTDWSMKTKLRFLSSRPFTWCQPLRTCEEASGLSSFARCENIRDVSQTENAKIEFHKCCQYWSHPYIPWLKLFPRIAPDNRIGKMTGINTDEDVKKSLMADWSESFTSLFHQLRAGFCPYFYVCTHQFTALFRAASVANYGQVHALLTPTTRGFREGLRTEGIEFSMPLKKKIDSPDTSMNEESRGNVSMKATDASEPTINKEHVDVGVDDDDVGEDNKDVGDDDKDVGDDDEDLAATDEGASSWLQSIGLDESKFPSLNPNKIKIQREGYKVIDNRPESLIYVEESETQALFNYLLNCRSCVAPTGPQSGVPPTLLAPVAFKGATLGSLKVKQTSVKQQNLDGALEQGFLMEAVGPILPDTLHNMCRVLKQTQGGDYSVVFSVHEQTMPLNIGASQKESTHPGLGESPNNNIEPENDTSLCHGSNFGVDKDTLLHLQADSKLVKTSLREVVCRDSLFTWTC